MKKGIHPEYRQVLFHDVSVDEYFLIPSTLSTDQTKEWKDGKTYPYCPLDVSSASHPFYTGQQKIIDTGGRVDRFKKRFAKKGASKIEPNNPTNKDTQDQVSEKAEAETSSKSEKIDVNETQKEDAILDVKEEISKEAKSEATEIPTEETVEEKNPKDKE